MYVGESVVVSIAQGGHGGGSPLGSPGGYPAHVFARQSISSISLVNGTTGILPGAGGGGSEWKIIDSSGNTSTAPPGPGADGLVIVEFIRTTESR